MMLQLVQVEDDPQQRCRCNWAQPGKVQGSGVAIDLSLIDPAEIETPQLRG